MMLIKSYLLECFIRMGLNNTMVGVIIAHLICSLPYAVRLLQDGTDIIPMEVKAGDHVRSKSLSVFRNSFSPAFSMRLSTRNFGFEDGLFSVPLYAAWLIPGMKEGAICS